MNKVMREWIVEVMKELDRINDVEKEIELLERIIEELNVLIESKSC